VKPNPNYQLHSGNDQVQYQLQGEEIPTIGPVTPIKDLSEEEEKEAFSVQDSEALSTDNNLYTALNLVELFPHHGVYR
jgi:hypothetical protein